MVASRWRAGYLLASFSIYIVDQAVRRGPSVRSDLVLIGRMRAPQRQTENRGIAFGQLQESGSFGRWFFVVLAGAAAAAVLYYFMHTPRNDDRVLGACALLLAGIAGNLTDRVRIGYVIDFIVLHAGSWHWPTFNVADASIDWRAAARLRSGF